MEQLPIFSVDLIDALDVIYPEASPDPALSERELWMRAGERRLVRSLVNRKKQLNENVLEN